MKILFNYIQDIVFSPNANPKSNLNRPSIGNRGCYLALYSNDECITNTPEESPHMPSVCIVYYNNSIIIIIIKIVRILISFL